MKMSGFERLIRNLRGLSTAYDISIEFDSCYTTGMVVLKYGNTSSNTNMHYKKDVPFSAIKNEIAFEEFLKETNKEWEKAIHDYNNQSECSNMPEVQSSDA